MVGYEPDFNPPKDAKLVWSDFLMTYVPERSVASQSRSLIKPSDVYDDANLLGPFLRPCNTHKVDDDANLSSRLTRPYHLRRVEDDDYQGRLATPLVQVFSVCISTDFDDGKSCEIYGSIRASEGPDRRFDLYNRDSEDSETIWKEGTLSLIGPDGGAIIPSMSTMLELRLKDRIRGVVVVEGQLNLDPLTEDSYDRLMKGKVQGAHGFADVYYVVFQFAQYATIEVTVTKNDNDDDNCNVADIYGSVVTAYENGRRYCSGDEEVKWLESRLFEKPPHQPLRVMLGTPIRLSRNVVAVPAYSSLTIGLNLWDSNGKIAGDCIQFPVYSLGENPFYIRTQFACVKVQVGWRNAYFYLYKDRFMQDSNRPESNNKSKEMQKKPRVLYYQHPSDSFVPRNLPPVYFRSLKAEVFTVFVSGINQKISALCGAILIDDGSDKFSIYNRDDSCSELLPDNSLASIEVNYRAILNSEFGMILTLRDPVGNLEVSRGSFGWNVCSLESYLPKVPMYNKRLCSIVRGDHGYAAVHYEIFSDAYEAHVKVKLIGDSHPEIPINLYGTLSGLYSGYEYSTSYQKKYYMSRLFDKPRDRSVELKAGSEIAVLKSIVVVPAYSSLIIEANLGAFGINNVDEPIRGAAQFEINVDGTISKTIRGEHYCIEVNVQFKP